jgi:uncharacterized protein YggU (UPF0235/DUF167 family)
MKNNEKKAIKLVLQVKPNSRKRKISKNENGDIKINLVSAAKENAANNELIEIISRGLRIPKKNVEIKSGKTGKKKLLIIDIERDLSIGELFDALQNYVSKK